MYCVEVESRELSWECKDSSCRDWLGEKFTVLVISALL
jgi:hypothetical protein